MDGFPAVAADGVGKGGGGCRADFDGWDLQETEVGLEDQCRVNGNLEGTVAGQVIDLGWIGDQKRIQSRLVHGTGNALAAVVEFLVRKTALTAFAGGFQGFKVSGVIHGEPLVVWNACSSEA